VPDEALEVLGVALGLDVGFGVATKTSPVNTESASIHRPRKGVQGKDAASSSYREGNQGGNRRHEQGKDAKRLGCKTPRTAVSPAAT